MHLSGVLVTHHHPDHVGGSMMGFELAGLAELLERKNIYCEFADPDYLVLMLPVEYDPALPRRICAAFESISPRAEITAPAPALGRVVSVLSPHAALFRPAEQVTLSQSLGRVMADPTVSCPPAIPVVCCGERIDQWAVDAMAYYGITQVRVLKETSDKREENFR